MKKHLLAGILSLSLILPAFPAEAAATLTETVLAKDTAGNPVFTADADGKLIYGADPSVLVDGDTVYLYAGHDESTDSEVSRKFTTRKSTSAIPQKT